MTRRNYIKLLSAFPAALFLKLPEKSRINEKNIQIEVNSSQKTRDKFNDTIDKALENEWVSLDIGELIGKIGMEFLGVSYAAGTLENKGPEVCSINLHGLDCVTFYENTLCMARILKKGKSSFENLVEEITYTRYRGGVLDGYVSRLHYTSDWIYDNVKKGVVSNITENIGGEPYLVKVSFMSENPQYYDKLKGHPERVKKIAEIEKEINSRKQYYIKQENIKEAEKYLQTGDIIAFTTTKKGLDYSHTGLAYRDDFGSLRLLHASTSEDKVILDENLHIYTNSVKIHTGITVARPLEPKTGEKGIDRESK